MSTQKRLFFFCASERVFFDLFIKRIRSDCEFFASKQINRREEEEDLVFVVRLEDNKDREKKEEKSRRRKVAVYQ